MGSAKDRILKRRAMFVTAAITTASAVLECGSDPMPQACLSAAFDSGKMEDVKDVVTEPQVCLTMPPPDSGDDASDGASDASDAADAKG